MAAKQSSVTDKAPWITCHVLDTVGGKPASDVRVRLTLLQSKQTEAGHWSGTTNQDGRIQEWHGQHQIQEAAEQEGSDDLNWELTFDSEAYFGKGNTFFPEVRIVFTTKSDQKHYHVPLLLGPWSYTTYRGS